MNRSKLLLIIAMTSIFISSFAFTMDAQAVITGIPDPPTGLVAVSDDHGVTLNWTAPAFTGYSAIDVYRVFSRLPLGTWDVVVTTSITYTFTGLNNGEDHEFKVAAHNAQGTSSTTPTVTERAATTPGAPTTVVATPGNANIQLSWSEPSDNGGKAVIGYRVYIGYSAGAELSTLYATIITTSQSVPYLTNGVPYFFTVAAFNAMGQGPNCSEVSATPVGPPTAPRTPEITAQNHSLHLTWDDPFNDGGYSISVYNIYRGTSADNVVFIGTSDVKNYYDDALTNGQTYYYKVSANNTLGEGPKCDAFSATPMSAPWAPLDLTASAGNGHVLLSWQPSAHDGGATIVGYSINQTSVGPETHLTTTADLSYDATGLTNGVMYEFKVRAITSFSYGPAATVAAEPSPIVPTAPSGLSAVGSAGHITLTWDTPSDDGGSPIQYYRIYRGTSSGTGAYIVDSSLREYTDTLGDGVRYYYNVTAVNVIGESPSSNEAYAMATTVPGIPTDVTAVAGQMCITISWTTPTYDGNTEITGYTVYRGAYSGAQYIQFQVTDTYYVDSSVDMQVKHYYYTVVARNSLGEGQESAEVDATALPGAPAVPTGVTVMPGQGINLSLSWYAPMNDGGSSILGYRIYTASTAGGETGTYLASVTQTTWTGIVPNAGPTIYFKVAAFNSAGEGQRSSEVSIAAPILPTVPGIVTGMQVVNHTADIVLTWNVPPNGGAAITGYHVYRGTSPGVSSGIAYQTTTSTSLVDTGSVVGTTYYYSVSAFNSIGDGPLSIEVNGTMTSNSVGTLLPGQPTGLHASYANAQVMLSWTSPVGTVTSYRVYRGTTQSDMGFLGTSTSQPYSDTAIVTGSNYYYSVSAVNVAGEGLTSASTSVSIPEQTSFQLQATPGDHWVSLGWQGQTGVSGYDIFRATDENGNDAVKIGTVTSTSYNDTSVTNDITYYYMVQTAGLAEMQNSTVATALPSGGSSPAGAGSPVSDMTLILVIIVLLAIFALVAVVMIRKRKKA